MEKCVHMFWRLQELFHETSGVESKWNISIALFILTHSISQIHHIHRVLGIHFHLNKSMKETLVCQKLPPKFNNKRNSR